MANARREKGCKLCIHHIKQEITFLCEDCDETICDMCVSSCHQRHLITPIALVAQSKFNFIQDFNNQVKSDIIPKINDEMKTAQDAVLNMERTATRSTVEVNEQRRLLHAKIDIIADQIISKMNSLVQIGSKTFDKFRLNSEKSMQKYEVLMKTNSTALKSHNNVPLIDIAKELACLKLDIPAIGTSPEIQFVKGIDTDNLLRTAFGSITEVEEILKQTSSNTHPMDPNVLPARFQQHLYDPKLIRNINLKFYPSSMAVTQDGTLWMLQEGTSIMHAMKEHGEMKELQLDSHIRDFTIHPETDILYCIDNDSNYIKTIDRNSGKTKPVCVVEGNPCTIAIAPQNQILVGDGKISMLSLYTIEGYKLIMKFFKARNPCQISVCNVTGMIAASCSEFGVKVFDSDFKEQYTYKGPCQTLQAYDAKFDNKGNLVVVDFDRHEVHMVKAATGEQLARFTSDEMIGNAISLALTNDGNVFVGTYWPHKLLAFTL